MPTTKTRLNITLSPEIEVAIKQLAQRDKISRAGKVAELIRVALEIEEDRAWDALAKKRDRRGTKFFAHKKAWA
jgi:hypothetical protein